MGRWPGVSFFLIACLFMRYETIEYISHHLISPDPLLRASHCLRASISPPTRRAGEERAID